jgi:formylglycine-generating enzyme required for sulfatase activity
MVGNVWEWVADRYGSYPGHEVVNPRGAEVGAERVLRGGAWNTEAAGWARATFRHKMPVDARSHGVGFRCAADPR